ncbi:MAG: PaaI family thioesterase [Gammaproteobacteria bacterium]|nr:PaaI family thioesterase [Gammaproteobacteria bacterium]
MDIAGRIEADKEILELFGMKVVELDAGVVVLSLVVRKNMVNAAGFCHGGVIFSIADSACAYALGSAGSSPATADANISFLKAALLGDEIVARAEVLRQGRRLGHASVDVRRDGDGELLAVYRASCANIAQ